MDEHPFDSLTGMDADREKPSPYGSAHDLPSVVEMRQMLTGMKLHTRVVARDQREKLVELEQEMTALFDLVDRFYAVLGGRHWIFTDHLPVSEVRTLLASAATVDAAEEGLIGIIAERLSSRSPGAHAFEPVTCWPGSAATSSA